MPHFGPIKRRELAACFRWLGFSGPFAGGRHEFMMRGLTSVTLPNPHGSDMGINFPAKGSRQAGITRGEWEAL